MSFLDIFKPKVENEEKPEMGVIFDGHTYVQERTTTSQKQSIQDIDDRAKNEGLIRIHTTYERSTGTLVITSIRMPKETR